MYPPEDIVIGHPLAMPPQTTQPPATEHSHLTTRERSIAQQPETRAPGSCHQCGHVGQAEVSKVYFRTQTAARM